MEEGGDAAAGVLSGRLVVADSNDLHHPEQNVAVIVEERVPGVAILLHVVGHAHRREDALQLVDILRKLPP